MKIFITGVAGFLGSHLADRFLELDHEVSGCDNMIGGDYSNVPKGVRFFSFDCRDEAMYDVIEGHDAVIHCAATAHEGLSVFSPAFITRNIFEASVNVISASIAANVKRFVFCSSMARYGKGNPPFTEDHKPRPVDPYGIAKVAAEDVLKSLCKVHGMEWNIAVPHNIVGPRQKYDDPYRNVVSIMINRNLQGLPSIIYGDGEQQRCFSYIDDVVSCFERLVLGDVKNEIVNVGPDEQTISINKLSELVANACGYNGDPIYVGSRPLEVKHAECSSNKARKLLGYETKTTVEEAVKKTAEWIKESGPKPFQYNYPLEIINEKTPETWKNRLI